MTLFPLNKQQYCIRTTLEPWKEKIYLAVYSSEHMTWEQHILMQIPPSLF